MKRQGQYRNIASSKLIGVLLATALLAALALAQSQPAVSGASKEFQPLTPAQKFQTFAQTTYDPLVWAAAGFAAGLDQTSNFPAKWRQGGAAYGRRFGAELASQESGAFFGRFLLPTILRQDPRYVRRGNGGFGARFGNVVRSVFVTRTDSGRRTFNGSLIGGALMSGALANAYYPDEERGAGLTLTSAGFVIGGEAGNNLRLEFWPDVRRKLFSRKPSAGK